MQRMGMVIRLRPEHEEAYVRMHRDVWPDVLACIAACNIRNFTIFLRKPEMLLFAILEYHGSDWAADMARMKADPATQRWWAIMEPFQEPLPDRPEGDWWAPLHEVFHVD